MKFNAISGVSTAPSAYAVVWTACEAVRARPCYFASVRAQSVHFFDNPCISVHIRAHPCEFVHVRARPCKIRAKYLMSVQILSDPCTSVHIRAWLSIITYNHNFQTNTYASFYTDTLLFNSK